MPYIAILVPRALCGALRMPYEAQPHVTLAYFPKITVRQEDMLTTRLRDLGLRGGQVTLEVGPYAVFGTAEEPRAVRLIKESLELLVFRGAVVAELETCGIERSRRWSWKPHITTGVAYDAAVPAVAVAAFRSSKLLLSGTPVITHYEFDVLEYPREEENDA